jgi:hypothetical protein
LKKHSTIAMKNSKNSVDRPYTATRRVHVKQGLKYQEGPQHSKTPSLAVQPTSTHQTKKLAAS